MTVLFALLMMINGVAFAGSIDVTGGPAVDHTAMSCEQCEGMAETPQCPFSCASVAVLPVTGPLEAQNDNSGAFVALAETVTGLALAPEPVPPRLFPVRS